MPCRQRSTVPYFGLVRHLASRAPWCNPARTAPADIYRTLEIFDARRKVRAQRATSGYRQTIKKTENRWP